MPKKLQIKLLSNSAELLSMTNCSAGQISVLRSESPSELRPYQRALGGNQGRERLIITVDSKDYVTDEHNLIGFGEVAPYNGMTVTQYLNAAGLVEGAISGLLMAYGIESCADKPCTALSPDEERKVRLFAATADPNRALILNEPFEPIANQWRERIAELLSDFARTKNGLVVVASLSYRPDSWIDNPAIARHQVGQSLRRTIGFGAAGSDSNQFINDLRDQIRRDSAPSEASYTAAISSPESNRPLAAASLSAAAMTTDVNLNDAEPLQDADLIDISSESLRSHSWFSSALKTGSALGAGGLGVWAAVTILGIYPAKDHTPNQERITAPKPPAAIVAPSDPQNTQSEPNNPSVVPSAPASRINSAPSKRAYILDRYPEAIRVSILDASRGILGDPMQPPLYRADQVEPVNKAAEEGNIYKLLEKASSDNESGGSMGGDAGDAQDNTSSWSPSDSTGSSEYDPNEEESRREEIRQKFLEAIRAAADRREQEGMGQ